MVTPKFIARKPVIKTGTYRKYGVAITLHRYCKCPRCKKILNAGPDYHPKYCDQCGQKVDYSDVVWQKKKEFGYVR